MIGLALLVSAAAASQVIKSDCSMGECWWFRKEARQPMLRNRDGELVRYAVLEGRSRHPDDRYPKTYSSPLHVRFRPKTYYAFCSRMRPSVAFKAELGRDRGKWLAHLLNLHDLFGYNGSSAVIYFAACHGVDLNRQSLGIVMKRFRYDEPTPSAQIELRTPVDLADSSFVARALRRSGQDVGSRH
jgi:hypothetical protein